MDSKLKKQVRAKKAVFSRSLTELDKLVQGEKSEDEVSMCIESLKRKKTLLIDSQDKYLAELSEESLEEEVESWSQLETPEITHISKARQYLAQTRQALQPAPAAARAAPVGSQRLEAIRLAPFEGDPSIYPEFITAFRILIDQDPTMTVMEKMLRLKGKTGWPGLARRRRAHVHRGRL